MFFISLIFGASVLLASAKKCQGQNAGPSGYFGYATLSR
jgi:hypothetical protein